MPQGFEHCHHVCLDILSLAIFCFVLPPYTMSLPTSPAALQPPDSATPSVLLVSSQSVSLLQGEHRFWICPGRVGERTQWNAVRSSGEQRSASKSHTNPQVFLPVWPQLPVPALCMEVGGLRRLVGSIAGMHPLTTWALLFQQFSPRTGIWCRELLLTCLMLQSCAWLNRLWTLLRDPLGPCLSIELLPTRWSPHLQLAPDLALSVKYHVSVTCCHCKWSLAVASCPHPFSSFTERAGNSGFCVLSLVFCVPSPK